MSDEAWIDTVRLARDFGDVSQLLPAGVSSLRDIPWRLKEAVKAALMFLGFEELQPDDVPPHNIWTDGEALHQHFDEVKRKHASEASGKAIEDPVQNGMLDLLIQ